VNEDRSELQFEANPFFHVKTTSDMSMKFAITPVRIIIACCIGLQALVALAIWAHSPLIMTSWASSSALIAMLRSAPAARVKAVFGGHVVSTMAGMAVLIVLGPSVWWIGPAVSLAVLAMWATDTVHPPAAANAAIIFVTPVPLLWFGGVTLAGAAGLALVAYALSTWLQGTKA
jgi:CBS-domain-containing membrane protein